MDGRLINVPSLHPAELATLPPEDLVEDDDRPSDVYERATPSGPWQPARPHPIRHETLQGLTNPALQDPSRSGMRPKTPAIEMNPTHAVGEGLLSLFGSLERIPRARVTHDEAKRLRLSPDAAFLLGQIDGATSIGDIADIAPFPRAQTLELLARLVFEGAIELTG